MPYVLRECQGSLFRNDRKENDSQPNARGRAMIGGVEYEIAAWTKTDKNGNKWQSLSFKNADERPTLLHGSPARPNIDDDVPYDNPYRGGLIHAV